MKRTRKIGIPKPSIRFLVPAVAAGLGLLAGPSAKGQVTIANGSTQTVTGNPLTTFWDAAGTVTMEHGSTLYHNQAGSQSAPPTGYNIPNALVFAGEAGTITLRFNSNDTKWHFSGPVTSTATGNQMIDIRTGVDNQGDRLDVLFSTPIPDGTGGATTGLNVVIGSYAGSPATSYVNLSAVNTFTGPISLSKTITGTGYLVIGGERYEKAFDATKYTVPGTGSLGSGNYPGNISLAAGTVLSFNTSANQTLSGIISGAGSLRKEVAGSTLTLAGANNITGNTTVDAGTFVLAGAGSMSFTVTNASSNKITGAGTAELNGTFNIDTSAVTVGTGSWTLVDTTGKSFGGTFGLTGFSGPVGNVYTKSSGGKTWTFDKSDGVLRLSSTALFNSFQATVNSTNYPGVIDNGLLTVRLVVPKGTNLSTLAPTFTLTSGSCNRTSGAVPTPNFATTNPLTYTITDGTTVNNYTVTVVEGTGIINVSLEKSGNLSSAANLTGPAGGLGETWNQVTGTSATGLLDSVGLASTVGFTTTGLDGLDQWGSPALQMLWSGLRRFATGETFQVTISGLTPGDFYHVYIGSANVNSGQRSKGDWATPNETQTVGIQSVDNTGTLNVTTWEQGNNYVAFNYVKVDVNGRIILNGDAAAAYRLPLNGFQLVPSGSPLALITSFGIPGHPGVIDQNTRTVALTVPYGTNLATMAPTFTLTSGTCNQTSGAPPSPTFAAQNPVTYTVTDDSTEPDTVNNYQVTVNVAPQTATLVINLGTSPAGTEILGGAFLGSGPTNLPIPVLPSGSILKSIAVDCKLEDTDNGNFASDLAVLLDPTPGAPGGDFAVEITNGTTPFGATVDLGWPVSANSGAGTPLVDSKTDAEWASVAPIDLATTGLFLGNSYGGPSTGGIWSGTITLTYLVPNTGSPYDAWKSQITNGLNQRADDADGDGFNNLQEFLFGTSPIAGNGALMTTTASGGNLVLRWLQRESGATYTLKQSPTLGTNSWTPVVSPLPVLDGNQTGAPADYDYYTVTLPTGAGKLFFRIEGIEN